MVDFFLAFLVFVFIVAGFVFVFVPGLPGQIIAWLGMPLYLIFVQTDVPAMTWTGVGVCGFLAGASFFADWAASSLGAKKFGGTVLGAVGAFLGGIVFPIIFAPLGWFAGILLGVIAGPAIGAVVFEWLSGKKSMKQSLKIGWGAFVGGIATFALKIIVVMILFVYAGTSFLNACFC